MDRMKYLLSLHLSMVRTMPTSTRIAILPALLASVFCTTQVVAQVSLEWVAMYNGAANLSDYAYAMAIDEAGNVYVAGEAVQGSNLDFVTIKYNAAGDTVWVRLYNGPGNSRDVARAICVDENGNVYVTGESILSGTNYDAATVKYNAAGVQQWVRRYNGLANGNDGGLAIALDGLGNSYVTGYSDGDPNTVFEADDYITIKYDSGGNQQWARRYSFGGDGNAHDYAKALAVDSSGNCFVTGRSAGPGSGYDYVTIKYSATGDSSWARRYNGTGNNTDDPYAIAVDIGGNVYVTGSSRSGSSNEDYLTIKYNPSGDTVWTRRYVGLGAGDDAYALKLDASGNVYVTGQSRSTGFGADYDYLTIKYNDQGDTLWTARYDGPKDTNDVALSLAVDNLGGVYVTGYSYALTTGYDYATVKYNANGIQQWVQRYAAPGTSFDLAVAVAVDSASNVYVTGRGNIAGQALNIITIKYSQGPTDVGQAPLPYGFRLSQNYPNPFNPRTTIEFQISNVGYVTLKVYDVLGREVGVLVNEELEAGSYMTTFSAEGGSASGGDALSLASGVYLYRLATGGRSTVNKMVLMK